MPQNITEIDPQKLKEIFEYPQFRLKFDASVQTNSSSFQIFFITQEGAASSAPQLEFFGGKKSEVIWSASQLHIGLGKQDELDAISLGSAFLQFGSLAKKIQRRQVELFIDDRLWQKFTRELLANLLVTGFINGGYSTELLKSKKNSETAEQESISESSKEKNKEKIQELIFVGNQFADDKQKTNFISLCQQYLIQATHISAIRQIQALPGNYLTADTMTMRLEDLARKYSLKLKIFGEKELQEMGAGGILAVNQGSVKEPKMLVLEYHPEDARAPTLAFVGKGVTFDTGGISLKPGADMHEMKYDMCGSAAASHAIAAIAELQLPIRAIAVIGMVENMPDGAALKPGDVYTSLKGLTIEVQNTDAEGRLVLADLLNYTEKTFKPDLMVDLATLTGACAVALGPFYAGLFSPNNSVVSLLQQAADHSLEPLWHLPLGQPYIELLKSDIADYNNIGGRYGGSSSAAAFLSLFVDKQTNWAHLDIASIAFIKKSYGVYPSVSAGYGIRLLVSLAKLMIEAKKNGNTIFTKTNADTK